VYDFAKALRFAFDAVDCCVFPDRAPDETELDQEHNRRCSKAMQTRLRLDQTWMARYTKLDGLYSYFLGLVVVVDR
jgi:hypothetical protein